MVSVKIMSEEKKDSEESKLDSDEVEEESELSLIETSKNNETDIKSTFLYLHISLSFLFFL